MFLNACVSVVDSQPQRQVANAALFALPDSSNENKHYIEKIILQPGLTFRNITNNTSKPMDITEVIQTLDKQLHTKLCC